MKLFVTGATGFVGSHFVRQAIAAGHEVVALKRSTASQPRVPLPTAPIWLEKPMDRLEAADFGGVEVVVHLAAHTANVPYDPLETCLHWNVTVPLRMAERAHDAGVRRFVVAGSCFEYGRSAERYAAVPVDAPLEPTSSYPVSKAAASVAFGGFAAERGAQLQILRLFQVYGEGEQATRFWPSLCRAAREGRDFRMSLGEQVRDFVDVTDVAAVFVRSLDFSGITPGVAAIKNVGTGTPQTLRAFAEHWWRRLEATGRLECGAVPYRPNEIMRLVPLL